MAYSEKKAVEVEKVNVIEPYLGDRSDRLWCLIDWMYEAPKLLAWFWLR